MTQSKAQRLKEARAHLNLANKQWDDAATAWWPPADAAECVTKCFYAYENAIVAAAIALGISWKRQHQDKARIARELAKQGKVSTDIGDLLGELNELRKDVSYGEAGAELASADLESYVSDLESYLSEVGAMIDEVEGL